MIHRKTPWREIECYSLLGAPYIYQLLDHKNNPLECWNKSLKYLDKSLKRLDKP